MRLTNAILNLALSNPASNQIVIPTLQTLQLILDAGILGKLGGTEAGTEACVRGLESVHVFLNNLLLFRDQPTDTA